MANNFDGPVKCDHGALISIRFRDIIPENHPVWYVDKFINEIAPVDDIPASAAAIKSEHVVEPNMPVGVYIQERLCRMIGIFWFRGGSTGELLKSCHDV